MNKDCVNCDSYIDNFCYVGYAREFNSKKCKWFVPIRKPEVDLQKEIHKLKQNLEKAIKALEFYASKESYASEDVSRSTGNSCFDILLFDFSRDLEPKKDYAGKLARETLKEIRGEK